MIGWQSSSDGPAVALLSRNDEQFLSYAGSAFITLAEPVRTLFWEAVHRLSRVASPVPEARTLAANWVTPEVKVRVRHLRCPGRLRHATLCGLVR